MVGGGGAGGVWRERRERRWAERVWDISARPCTSVRRMASSVALCKLE